MTRLAPYIFWMVLWGGLWGGPCLAGHLTMTAEATVKTDDRALELVVRLHNGGDEPALNIQATPLWPHGAQEGPRLQELDPGRIGTLRIPWPMEYQSPGGHIAVARVVFRDIAGRPFSLLAWGPFTALYQAPSPLKLHWRATAVSADNTPRTLVLINPLDRPVDAVVRVFTPLEVEARPMAQDVTVPANERLEMPVDLINLTGVRGARYDILAVVDYDLDGLARSAAAMAPLVVAQPLNYFGRTQPWWIALAVALAAAWLFMNRRRKRR